MQTQKQPIEGLELLTQKEVTYLMRIPETARDQEMKRLARGHVEKAKEARAQALAKRFGILLGDKQ